MVILISLLHGLALFGLFLLGTHRTHLLLQFERGKNQFTIPNEQIHHNILVQLPVYNEANVVEASLIALSKQEWPHGQLHIQVLDDSTDETTAIIQQVIAEYRGPHRITHIQRSDRAGYKAGALANGLKQTNEPLIAIFDADFQPDPTFLRELTGHFANAPGIGMVQGRWEHSNRNQNRLTKSAAVVLDGHFVIEHSGRHLQDCFFNFNGTAGVWRRQCIEDAGGWQSDTITEDLDLSYRAQLAGWKFIYTPLTAAKAEIPSTMLGLIVQQYRWAKGTTQTAVKILPRLWTSNQSLRIKLEGSTHMLANLGYWMTLLLSIVLPYTSILRWNLNSLWSLLDLSVFLSSFVALIIFHQRSQHFLGQWKPWSVNHWQSIIGALIIGVGIAPFQSFAIIEGFFGSDLTFERTPKSGLTQQKRYVTSASQKRTFIAYLTIALALYSVAGLMYSLHQGNYFSLPFQTIFSVGYAWVGLSVLRDSA